MYEHHPEFYINSASLQLFDRKGTFGKFQTDRLELALIDPFNELREDIFAATNATFDDIRSASGPFLLAAKGDMEIERVKLGQIMDGTSMVRLEGTWALTDEVISAEFKAKIHSVKLTTLIPRPSGDTVQIKDLTISLKTSL